MTDMTLTGEHRPHTLISWPAIIVGAIVAAAVGAMLNLLGVALGAASFNPYDLDANDATAFSAAAGMWMAVANAAALFVGAAVASRAAKYPDHHKGALHGLGVWALAFMIALVIASASAAGGAAAVAGGEAADPTDPNVIVSDTGARSRVIAGELAPVVQAPAPAPVREVADEAADATATLALWGFLTMLIGAVAAIVGGMYGARGHRWMAKAGLDSQETAHAHAGETYHPVAGEPVAATPHKVYPTPRT